VLKKKKLDNFMLYYIIPPLVIVICLAILASFLFKKASQIPAREFSHPVNGERRGLKKIVKATGQKTMQLTLRILERAMQWFKLLSLRFHNLFQKWFQSIREKRKKTDIIKKDNLFEKENVTSRDSVEEKRPVFGTDIVPEKEMKSFPMVSKKIVRPEPQVEMKNRLESALIERIAANPQDIEAYERLGDYYFEQGNHLDALECFRQVIKLSPLNRRARAKLRKLERILGK
jgi:tetratricopeptide (TPR) repeat protein